MLREALAIVERAYGPVHPRVASALNELGRIARQQGRLDEAEAVFRRMADIYRKVYNDRHYLIGVALSNIGGVYQERKQYARAEAIFRDVLRRYGEVLAPDHQLVGIARIRLGGSLLAQRRYSEAERESLAGYRSWPGHPTLRSGGSATRAPTWPPNTTRYASRPRRPGSGRNWPIPDATRPERPRHTLQDRGSVGAVDHELPGGDGHVRVTVHLDRSREGSLHCGLRHLRDGDDGVGTIPA